MSLCGGVSKEARVLTAQAGQGWQAMQFDSSPWDPQVQPRSGPLSTGALTGAAVNLWGSAESGIVIFSQLTLSTRWDATRLLTDHAANMYAPPALIPAIAADSSAITRACPRVWNGSGGHQVLQSWCA